MFGSQDYRSSRSRGGRSSFGGQRGRSSSRQDRRPPYASQEDFDSRGASWDSGYNSRGGPRRYEDRRGGASGRYRGGGANEWEDEHTRRSNYRGRGSYHYQPNGRGGGSYHSGSGGDGYNSRGRGRRPRQDYHDNRWDRNAERVNGQDASWRMPDGLEWMVNIKGHAKKITCIVFDESSGKMFTASDDATVRVWSAETGQCEHTVSYDGEVKVLLLAGGYLFVGVHKHNSDAMGLPGEITVYNLAKNTEENLSAHSGAVVCLHAVKDLLFSGGEDKIIKAWKFNPGTDQFDPAGHLGIEQGGHPSSVLCLASISNFLFSADRAGNLRVWNLDTGELAQRIDKGHHRSVMSMITWKDFLITGSLDGYLLVWKFNEDLSESAGPPLDATPYYKHRIAGRNGPPPGILSCCGTPDAEGNPVLMVGLTTRKVSLYSLPEFEVKGGLPEIDEPKALAYAPGGYVFVGDMHGEIKVFTWNSVSETLDQSA